MSLTVVVAPRSLASSGPESPLGVAVELDDTEVPEVETEDEASVVRGTSGLLVLDGPSDVVLVVDVPTLPLLLEEEGTGVLVADAPAQRAFLRISEVTWVISPWMRVARDTSQIPP